MRSYEKENRNRTWDLTWFFWVLYHRNCVWAIKLNNYGIFISFLLILLSEIRIEKNNLRVKFSTEKVKAHTKKKRNSCKNNFVKSNTILSDYRTHFWAEFDLLGGTGGALTNDWDDVDIEGKEIGFFPRGGAGGRFLSDDDEIFDRVSSFELLLLLLNCQNYFSCSCVCVCFSLPFEGISLMY